MSNDLRFTNLKLIDFKSKKLEILNWSKIFYAPERYSNKSTGNS